MQWNNAHYETRNICFMKYIWRNSFIVLREETLHNFRCHINDNSNRDYNKLRAIYFLNVHRAANMYIAGSIFIKPISCNMFHRCTLCLSISRRFLSEGKICKIFYKFESSFIFKVLGYVSRIKKKMRRFEKEFEEKFGETPTIMNKMSHPEYKQMSTTIICLKNNLKRKYLLHKLS